MVEFHQTDFFSLLPGSAGGRALKEKRGTGHFVEMARAAAAERSPEERQAIAHKAARERRRRLYSWPRTVCREMAGWRIIERVIPYWPHQKGRRRRTRPMFVRIEVAVTEVESE